MAYIIAVNVRPVIWQPQALFVVEEDLTDNISGQQAHILADTGGNCVCKNQNELGLCSNEVEYLVCQNG